MPKLPRSVNGGRGKTTAAKKPKNGAKGDAAVAAPSFEHRQVDEAVADGKARNGGGNGTAAAAASTIELNKFERGLLHDLFAVIEEHAKEDGDPVDRKLVERAFVFACERHADQRRQSGEDFIVHPVGVAKICAGMRLDTATLCAALLHDTVEDTSASLIEVRDAFGEEIANLVDGVTKLTGITFQSRDDRQAENYRKMIVAMSSDIRVILIK